MYTAKIPYFRKRSHIVIAAFDDSPTHRVVMEVAHQILTRIWALSTSASCLRASISFWLWLWLCCCIFVLIFWSNLRRKLLGKWPQSSANACCRSQSGETPLIQHCSKPRNRINWLNGANESSFFANYFCNIQEKLSLQTLGVVPFRRIAKKGGDPAKLIGPSLILSVTARRHGQFQSSTSFAIVFSRAFFPSFLCFSYLSLLWPIILIRNPGGKNLSTYHRHNLFFSFLNSGSELQWQKDIA